MRVLRYRLRRGSGGAGLSGGGDRIERDVLVLEDCTVSLITERRLSQPWGLAGGSPHAVGENWLLPGGDEGRTQRLPVDRCGALGIAPAALRRQSSVRRSRSKIEDGTADSLVDPAVLTRR